MPICDEREAEILKYFGLMVTDNTGGVTVVFMNEIKGNRIQPWNVVVMSRKLWSWLKPLLFELYERRQQDKAKTANAQVAKEH